MAIFGNINSAIFGQMLFDEKTLKEKLEKYVESVKDG